MESKKLRLTKIIGINFWILLMMIAPSQAAPTYSFHRSSENVCPILKFDPLQKKWNPADPASLTNRKLEILKTYGSNGTVGVQVAGNWYSVNRACLIAVSETPLKRTDQKTKPNAWNLLVGMQKTDLSLTSNSVSYPLQDKWIGVWVGPEWATHSGPGWLLKSPLQLGLGVGSLDQTQSTAAFSYQNTGFTELLFRGGVGLGFAFTHRFQIGLGLGLLARYGKYQVPAGFDTLSSFHANLYEAFSVEIRFDRTTGVKLEASRVGSNLGFSGGLQFYVF